MTRMRKGQAPAEPRRAKFGRRFRERFYDPAYAPEREAIFRLERIAWEAYQEARDLKRGVQDTSRAVESDEAYRKLKK